MRRFAYPLFVAALAWAPVSASAQTSVSPRLELSSPSAPDEPGLDDVVIPEPPGAGLLRPSEGPQYPVPDPEEAARLAESEPTIRIPSRVTTRVRALDADLRALGSRGGGGIVNAVLSLLTGGLSITLGLLREPNTDEMSAYLYMYGAIAAARGVLDLVLTPDASGASIAYQHMPMNSRDDVRARLSYGENALSSLAEQSLIARILDAGLNLAAGAAVIPVLAAREFAFVDPLDYFALIGAGVSLISGIVTLAGTSTAEQRWGAYQQLRERLARERDEERGAGDEDEDEADHAALLPSDELRWSFSVAPSPNGAFASVAAVF